MSYRIHIYVCCVCITEKSLVQEASAPQLATPQKDARVDVGHPADDVVVSAQPAAKYVLRTPKKKPLTTDEAKVN